MEKNSWEIFPGTLDLLILKSLETLKSAHGYTIMESIWNKSGQLFRVEEGALYPSLHRMQLKGWLEAEWGVSEANRRAKYYKLTPEGLDQLTSKRTDWDQIVLGMQRLLET